VIADVLVAGIGNVFRGDDGFGVEVARQLAAQPPIEGVSVVDFGIRALHLSYALLDPPQLLLVVDACSRGQAPGTLFVLEPSDVLASETAIPDAHSMTLDTVLRSLRALGGAQPPLRIIACEPACLDERMGLSEPVERAVPRAVELVRQEIARARGASFNPKQERKS
jgi:hydrogenase maturation protease